ncbi:hypothetical protein HDU67_006187 [Dinochytrium kinnereticum]|nr:hypothetical protein HDU67_006187 [Dinochytrium kinnereticum]
MPICFIVGSSRNHRETSRRSASARREVHSTKANFNVVLLDKVTNMRIGLPRRVQRSAVAGLILVAGLVGIVRLRGGARLSLASDAQEGEGRAMTTMSSVDEAVMPMMSEIGGEAMVSSAFEEQRFFLYMPWEQLNNQLIALRCACAAARVLNRALVLPPLGYRHPNRSDFAWDFNFDVSDLIWQPLEKYLDVNAISRMPCKTVSLDEFLRWTATQTNFSLNDIYFNPIAKATNEKQIKDYYGTLLGLRISSIDSSRQRLSQLTKNQILSAFGASTQPALAMGSAFWLYGFGRIQPYPLTQFFSYMDHPIYRQTVAGVKASPMLMKIVHSGLSWLRYGERDPSQLNRWLSWPRKVTAVHIRRGDYWNKCRKIEDQSMRSKCYPTPSSIVASLDKASGAMSRWLSAVTSQLRPIVYVATNSKDVKKELEFAETRYLFVFFDDVFPGLGESFKEKDWLDPIYSALIDIELCSMTDKFIGNMFSSFSRSIFEKRELAGRTYGMF